MKKISCAMAAVTSIAFAAQILPVQEIEQQKDQWCWAATSAAVLKFYKNKVTQGEIVEYAYGDSSINQWNWLTGNATVAYNGKNYNPHGVDQIMKEWEVRSTPYTTALTEAQMKDQISNQYPFFIRWAWTKGDAHFVVGMGYLDNGTYQIMDPWFGNGYTVNTYKWIKTAQGGQGTWSNSLTTLYTSPTGNLELSTNRDSAKVSVQSNSIHLNGFTGTVTVEIFSLDGKRLFKTATNDSSVEIPSFAKGIHIVQVSSKTQRVILKI